VEIYVIQPGDTLFTIARRFGVPLADLLSLNQIPNPGQLVVGQAILIPVPPVEPLPKQTIETMGYFQSTDLNGLDRSLAEIGQYITYGALFQFPVAADGTISVPDTTEKALIIFRRYNVRPLLALTNWGATGFESGLARSIIGNETVKFRTIANLLDLIQRFGFDGVNVDFENMYPEDRTLYTNFIRDLGTYLGPEYLLTLAAPAKFSDNPTRPWVGAFDYAALGALADFIFLMTYEWHWIAGPPGPISPVPLIRQALTYATSQIPASKLLQGAPFYGYNWPLPNSPENPAVPVDLVFVYGLAFRNNAAINYDPEAQSPWFTYTDTEGVGHEVWFEDSRSMTAKYKVTREFNLRGVGWWSYINEPYGFPQNWPIMEERFHVVKGAARG
jgi:spore germination protein